MESPAARRRRHRAERSAALGHAVALVGWALGVLRRPRPLLRASVELADAANGLVPLTRRGYPTFGVFLFGLPTSEMPHVLGTVSVLDAVRRGLRGDFRGRRGRVALGMQAVTWAILAESYRRNVVTPAPVLDAALREGLGADYRRRIDELPPAPSPTGRPSGAIRTAWQGTRRFVEKSDVVTYGPHPENRADVWRRRDLPRDGKAPVLVQVPGGAWALGLRRPQAYPLMSHLADRGWICVSIGYRVSPRHTWPDHIVDVKRALAWVKENIAAYGGDPDFVAITGGSAGGHLSSLAALTPNDPVWQPGFPDADTSVVCAAPIYGRYDWVSTVGESRREFIGYLRQVVVRRSFRDHRQIYVDASPIHRLHADAPPFFVVHGTADSIIPVPEAREFVTALRAVSTAPVAYAELPGAQHAFDLFGSPRAHRTAEAVGEFLSWVYATSRPAAGSDG